MEAKPDEVRFELEAGTSPKSNKNGNMLQAIVGVLVVLVAVLIGVVGWLGSEVQSNHDDLKRLRSLLEETVVVQVANSHTHEGDTVVGHTVPDHDHDHDHEDEDDHEDDQSASVLLTTRVESIPAGHMFHGSLFRGSGQWASKMPMPFERSDHQVVPVGDMIYILGGLDVTGNILDSVLVYDTLLETYCDTCAPRLPYPVHRFGAALLDGKIHVIGGFDSLAGDAVPRKCGLVYNLESKQWAEGPCTAVGHADTCAAAVGGKLYIVAGYTDNYDTLATVEAYDPSTGKWSDVAPLPEPRGDIGCASMGGKLYAVGGYFSEEWAPTGFKSSVYAFTPAAGTWERKADMPMARGDKAVVVLDGERLMVVGGETHARGEVTQIPTHTVEVYHAAHDQWSEKALIPTARFRFGATQVGGLVYVFGGHVLCSSDWDTGTSDCPEKALRSMEMFFDLSHPEIFISTAADK